jgi:hypothetical protein
MSACFHTIHEQTKDQCLQYLSDYMADHETKIDQCIASYEDDAAKGVLGTYLQFGDEDEISARIAQMSFDDSMTAEELVTVALDIQRDLVKLYRELSEATSVPELSDLFNSLITLEENKGRHYTRALSELMTG